MIFRQVRWSKTVFSKSMWEGRTFFQKIVLTLLNERSIVFQYGISSHSEFQSKIWLIQRNEYIVLQVVLRRNNFFKK